jgi:GNAT superfamily N-acetyltransferase
MTQVPVTLREMVDADRNYVLSSWIRSYAGKSREARDYTDRGAFARDYSPVVQALVARSRVLIAALTEEPDIIVGWAAVEGETLHYVLVKPRWRQLGVARWLLADFAALPVAYTHTTSDSMRCPVPETWTYRRYRIWPAGEAA